MMQAVTDMDGTEYDRTRRRLCSIKRSATRDSTSTLATFDDARQWRDRAEEMRIVARGRTTPTFDRLQRSWRTMTTAWHAMPFYGRPRADVQARHDAARE